MLKEMSPKQKLSLVESTARINIWVGSVRSGKSYASLWRFLEYIQRGPRGDLMIIGKSADTIKRNIVSPLMDFLGVDVKYYGGKREMHLWDRKIYLVGANDDRAVTKIQGATLAGAYIDELTLIPKDFWSMLLTRLSIDNAKVFATTNPDSPFHWVKTDVIDRADILGARIWNFNLDDNPSLSSEYKRSLITEHTGVWKRRYIDGDWILADGSVFDFFDPSLHVLGASKAPMAKHYVVGIDYGTSNPTAFVLVGFNQNEFPRMWVEREYFWDSQKENRQKTDFEYAEDFKQFIRDAPAPIKIVAIDPAAASFRLELQRSGVRNIVDANNDVIDGIRHMSNLIATRDLQIAPCCTNLIREIGSYSWDSRASVQGIDKPLKKNDHLCDALRYSVSTLYGESSPSANPMTRDTLNEIKSRNSYDYAHYNKYR